MAKKKATKKTAKKATKKSAKKTTKKATKKASKKATKKSAKKSAKKAAPKATKKTAKKTNKPATPLIEGLKVGAPAPSLSLPSTGGKSIDLSSLKGKNVVLYFYPKDATPGCTVEGQDFTRLHQQFKDANTEVYGVSRDSMKSHENFKSKENYSIDLLSDSDEKLCNTFGVMKMKNMYGKQVRGIERSTFVIDADGQIVKEWRGVSVPGHAEEVLNFIKAL
jgi:peroxiredoxin Q/BCP